MKIIPVGAELFHATDTQNGQADRQTDGHGESNRHFLQFCESIHINSLWSAIVPTTA